MTHSSSSSSSSSSSKTYVFKPDTIRQHAEAAAGKVRSRKAGCLSIGIAIHRLGDASDRRICAFGDRPPREVCDQLDRASLSFLLNTAEGNGKRQRQVRAKFFDDARGSTMECAGCLDALVAKKIVGGDRIILGKQMLLRIVSMLCGLIDRFDTGNALHDEEAEILTSEDVQPVSYLKSRTRTRTRTKRN